MFTHSRCRLTRPYVPDRSAQKKEALVAGVMAAAGAALANPMVAQAAPATNLNNFLGSIAAGATVLLGIAGAITFVSTFDPVKRD